MEKHLVAILEKHVKKAFGQIHSTVILQMFTDHLLCTWSYSYIPEYREQSIPNISAPQCKGEAKQKEKKKMAGKVSHVLDRKATKAFSCR